MVGHEEVDGPVDTCTTMDVMVVAVVAFKSVGRWYDTMGSKRRRKSVVVGSPDVVLSATKSDLRVGEHLASRLI